MSLEITIIINIGFSIKRRAAAGRSGKLVLVSLMVLVFAGVPSRSPLNRSSLP
jgi:hypothetical protein